MEKRDFGQRLKNCLTISELLALKLAIQEEQTTAKERLESATRAAAQNGQFLPRLEFDTLRKYIRGLSVQQMQIDIKLAAMREDRRGRGRSYEENFIQAAREILPIPLYEDLVRRARELTEKPVDKLTSSG